MKNFIYLVGPEGARDVLVVDPAWDVDAIERQLQRDGKRLVGAFVTHHHGDHTNGLAPLLKKHDLPVYVQKAELDLPTPLRELGSALRPLAPGDLLPVPGLRLQALHTPGHTPGSQCLYAHDAVVSGDTLFANHCGRCDLPGGDPEQMFHSLTQVLGRLPADTRLLPGHDYGEVPVSTLERERAKNPYLRFSGVRDFVDYRMRPRA
jgi:glyoxylase-like metal-dependent hydrolase (beta-lactamase superfamily II)